MFKKLYNLDARGRNIFEIVVVVVFAVGFVAYMLISNAIEAKRIQEESMKTILVQDASRYFTVLGCAQKFVNTIQIGNKEDILTVLDEDYKEKNRINESTVHNYIPKLEVDSVYDYEGMEMYQHRISKNVVKFYLKGRIKKSILDEISTSFDYDLSITLYENEFTFSVRPGIEELDINEE